MIMDRKSVTLGIVIFMIFLSLTACTAMVGSSKGGSRYELKRSLTMPNFWETILPKDVKPVHDAVIEGVNDLGLKVAIDNVDRLSALVEGLFADGTEFKIRLSYEGPGKTRILINAGLTGSKSRSIQLFRAIEKRL